MQLPQAYKKCVMKMKKEARKKQLPLKNLFSERRLYMIVLESIWLNRFQ